ncbi:hypothetical protein PAXINDRAFT_105532 [Paxillus involutus ATCC 200175]|nr:hypothetical protein PAXINDRAFT_105532 [Paxillus involutus ATCC 200175]
MPVSPRFRGSESNTVTLPPFLQPLVADNRPSSTGNQQHHDAVFPESDGIRPVHVHWWPCKATDALPQTIFLFIPGNPGVIDFYPPFLNTVYDSDTSGRLAVLTYSHVGHAPLLDSKHALYHLDASHFSLICQVQNALRIIDAVKSTFGASLRIVLAGHSVGAWLALQALKLRSDSISSVFLLFPAIADIADTPNGRKLSWLFRAPLPRVTANIARAVYYLPITLLGMLFPSCPRTPLNALRSFLRSPQAIFASMSMAHDEMVNICRLDSELLNKHRDVLWFYFGEHDDWIGKQKDAILKVFRGNEPRIAYGASGVPHAFCISESAFVQLL